MALFEHVNHFNSKTQLNKPNSVKCGEKNMIYKGSVSHYNEKLSQTHPLSPSSSSLDVV